MVKWLPLFMCEVSTLIEIFPSPPRNISRYAFDTSIIYYHKEIFRRGGFPLPSPRTCETSCIFDNKKINAGMFTTHHMTLHCPALIKIQHKDVSKHFSRRGGWLILVRV